MKLRTIFLSIFLTFSFLGMSGQQTTKSKDTLTMGVDLMSRYIFRGTDVGGNVPSIQPHLEYTTGKLSLGLWGAYATSSTGSQEADIYATYNFSDKIGITLTDYYFPTDDGQYHYFDYRKNTTGHLFELNLHYTGGDKLPLNFLIATNFYGADALRLNPDGSKKDIQYSTYAELSYSFKYFDGFIGLNLTDPDENLGETGFYGDTFGVVNLGITAHKKIKASSTFELPLSFSLITNPETQNIFLVLGISL